MYSIGQLSRATGVKVTTIRYYEQMGLIAHDGRTAGNQRRYGQAGLDRLGFIRHARDLGLSLEAIRALVALEGDGACAKSHAIAEAHLQDVRDRIRRLKALERELVRIKASCKGDGSGPCSILTAFGDHGLCSGGH